MIKQKFKEFLFFWKNYFSTVNEEPIFILGNQKSGTTAIAALLSEATQLSVTLDLIRAIPDTSLQLRLKYGLQTFDSFLNDYRYEFSRKIIKEPMLTIFYKNLKTFFPKGKFVFIVRDPRDNIRSILNRLRIPGDKNNINAFSYAEIQKAPVWSLSLDTSWIGEISTTYIDALSKRWSIFCKSYEQGSILVRYEDFIKDKENTIYRLSRMLGINVVNSIAEKVDVQYQSKGNNRANWDEFYGKENLRLIELNCQNYMKCFNYGPSCF